MYHRYVRITDQFCCNFYDCMYESIHCNSPSESSTDVRVEFEEPLMSGTLVSAWFSELCRHVRWLSTSIQRLALQLHIEAIVVIINFLWSFFCSTGADFEQGCDDISEPSGQAAHGHCREMWKRTPLLLRASSSWLSLHCQVQGHLCPPATSLPKWDGSQSTASRR